MAKLEYQSGFANEFATEAIAGALPQGQNAPQKSALGLYTEQFSGTPFTSPRAVNRRTWTYRIRPSVTHKPYEEIPAKMIRSGPFTEVPTPPNQSRWNPYGGRQWRSGDAGWRGYPHLCGECVDAGSVFLQRRWGDVDCSSGGQA